MVSDYSVVHDIAKEIQPSQMLGLGAQFVYCFCLFDVLFLLYSAACF